MLAAADCRQCPSANSVAGMDDRAELAALIDTWYAAVQDLLDLVGQIPDEHRHTPTDLPGWDVHDVMAHIAHLESVLAGDPDLPAEIGNPAHVTTPLGYYTELGVVARRDRTMPELADEIDRSARRRRAELVAQAPADGRAQPPRQFPGVSWDWRTLLANRPVDVWMHEQDIRRAVGMPGGLTGAGARHTVNRFLASLGAILAKRAAAPAGTTVRVHVTGFDPVAYAVDGQGRGVPVDPTDATPDLDLDFPTESFVVLCGGRRERAAVPVTVSGDGELAERFLAALTMTP